MTDNTKNKTSEARQTGPELWLIILIAAIVGAIFYEHLHWLVDRWWASEYYGHGFLIPIISGYLVYRRRDEIAKLPRENFGGGIGLLVLSLLLHYAATYMDVHFASGFAFIGVLMGLTWLLWGWRVLKAVLFPLLFLCFMVPLGKLLVNQVAQPMQVLSARGAGLAAQILGMPVTIEGTRLIIPNYVFEVAIACSGLKSAIAMTALGALLAYLVRGPLWKKLLLFATSLPVAMCANGVRIWLTLILGRSLGSKVAEGFFHEFSGILVFLLGFLGLFGVTKILRCSTLRRDI
ncbi:MAG: exosortase/archaeosortase family protein [Armatimonadota bacterium]